MSPAVSPQRAGFLARWERFWFEEIPPHSYALLRILFGLLGCLNLIVLSDFETFWDPEGLVSADDKGLGLKPFLLSLGLGDVAGRIIYFASLAAYGCMALGFRSGLAVASALVASLVQVSWNYLPLSGAHAVVQVVLFCLVWADCGAVWSVDSWLARRRGGANGEPAPYAIAPLRLIRFQVALIYLNSGLWKLYNPHWRDGSAVHYVLNSNMYHRFPVSLPPNLEWAAMAATYVTLLWEIAFPLLLLSRPTRRLALLTGVVLHLGMLVTLEIGLFHFVMLASYIAFLDPYRTPMLPRRVIARIRGVRVASGDRAARLAAAPSLDSEPR